MGASIILVAIVEGQGDDGGLDSVAAAMVVIVTPVVPRGASSLVSVMIVVVHSRVDNCRRNDGRTSRHVPVRWIVLDGG